MATTGKGTTQGRASSFKTASTTGVKHGPHTKNLDVSGRAKSPGKPHGPTGPIKGSNRGGV